MPKGVGYPNPGTEANKKRKYSNADNKRGNMKRALDRRQAPKGWFPTDLRPSDKKLYNAYIKKYGKASNTWADGSPRNPMPEIRLQSKEDN